MTYGFEVFLGEMVGALMVERVRGVGGVADVVEAGVGALLAYTVEIVAASTFGLFFAPFVAL